MQGLTAEWVALRSMSLQLKEFDESFNPTNLLSVHKTRATKSSSPHTSFSKLVEALRKRHADNIEYSKELTASVERLDKLRKQLKAHIFDLESALDSDMKTSQKMAESESVMPLNRAMLLRGHAQVGRTG